LDDLYPPRALGFDCFIVTRDRRCDAADIEALVALDASGERIGLLTYRIGDYGFEVVTLDSMRPGTGVATALVARATEIAHDAGLSRLFLTPRMTTWWRLVSTRVEGFGSSLSTRVRSSGRDCSRPRSRSSRTTASSLPTIELGLEVVTTATR